MESTLDSSERFSKAASAPSASLVLRVVRRRTAVGLAVVRLVVRVGLFFGAGIQRNLSRETNSTGRGSPRASGASNEFAERIAQLPSLSKGSCPNRAKLPTRLIALNHECGEASETLKTHRIPHSVVHESWPTQPASVRTPDGVGRRMQIATATNWELLIHGLGHRGRRPHDLAKPILGSTLCWFARCWFARWPIARNSPENCGKNKFTKRLHPGLRLHTLPTIWGAGAPSLLFLDSQQIIGSQPPEWHVRLPQFTRKTQRKPRAISES
ncbi:MAG: hypothetical protein FD138_523 [Planctomycetota bacterium]|nr:MAG: hypothetical protein FD138_523 [Planctomycetota bacterium]